MDSLEEYDKHDDQQKESSSYRAVMITGSIILVVIAFFAAIRIGWKLTAIRNQTGPFLKRMVMVGLIIGGLIAVFLITLNYRGKWNEKKHS